MGEKGGECKRLERGEGEAGKGRIGKIVREDTLERWFSMESMESLDSVENAGRKRRIEEVEKGTEEIGGVVKKSDMTRRSTDKKEKEVGLDRENRENRKLEELIINLVEEVQRMRTEMKEERKERKRLTKEWRMEKEMWKEERKEEERKREKIEKWMEAMNERQEKVEGKVEEMGRDKEVERKTGGEGGVKGEVVEECRKKIRRLEVLQDKREREMKRKNIIIKRAQVEGKDPKEEVKRVWDLVGMSGEGIEEIGRIGKADKDGCGMIRVKMVNFEQKMKVMEKRRCLKGKKVWLDDDLTEEKRKTRWKIEREAEKEREGEKSVQVGYMKIWVNGKMKRWNEMEEVWYEEQGNELRGNGGGEMRRKGEVEKTKVTR